MNVVIIEDEILAQERLELLIHNYDSNINIVAKLESIEESINWLLSKPMPDLLFVDIHLSDGHSFEIFKKIQVQKPVIFTTAYDSYAMDAFKMFSIDYILKPVTSEALGSAINKYKNISTNLAGIQYSKLGTLNKEDAASKYKNRFAGKIGQRTFFIPTNEVAYFYSENKIVYLINTEGNRFVLPYTLEKLEPLLDPFHFFRINRKIIVNAVAIEMIKPYINNRLIITLKGIKNNEEMIVSRERISDFKEWAEK